MSNKIFTMVNKYFQKIKVTCGRLSRCWCHTGNAELSRGTSGEEECWYFSCVTRILAAVVQQITQLGPCIVNTFHLPNFLSISLSHCFFCAFHVSIAHSFPSLNVWPYSLVFSLITKGWIGNSVYKPSNSGHALIKQDV